MRQIQTVLFDLDGTLLHTAPTLMFVVNQLLSDKGLAPVSEAQFTPLVSRGAKKMVEFAFRHYHPEAIDELLAEFMTRYDFHLSHLTEPFPSTRKVLKTLEQSGINWGVVTNKKERFALPLMDIFGLSEKAQCIVCGDTTEHKKPHPLPIEHACKLMNIKPAETIYVGDAESDIIAGSKAGTKTMVAGFGYIPTDDNPASWGADHFIDDLEQLIPVLHQYNQQAGQ